MPCPICKLDDAAVKSDSTGRDTVKVDCLHCGSFSLSGSLYSSLSSLLEGKDAAPKISHVIRKAHEAGKCLDLNTYTAKSILENPLPRPREQADMLLQWLAVNSPGPGESVSLTYADHGAVAGAKSDAGFSLLIEHLLSSGMAKGLHQQFLSGRSYANIALTFAGWDAYENLRLGGSSYRKAFMAMKFGDSTLDQLLGTVLKPAAKRAGFDLFNLDERPKAGLIDDRMRVEIRASDFIIADLTHDNLGAYWEAGFAEGLGKPVIYTCERGKLDDTHTHFDTNHHLTIAWSLNDPEEVGQKLVETIRATLPHLAKLVDD